MPLLNSRKKQDQKNGSRASSNRSFSDGFGETEELKENENSVPVVVDLKEAVTLVQQKTYEELEENEGFQQTISRAMAGHLPSVEAAEIFIRKILEKEKIVVKGMALEESSRKIFADLWGLGPVEDYYRDPEVEEIRVNGPDHVFIQRRGKNEKTGIKFADEEEVEKIIKRMIMEDAGISLDRSNPRVESVRMDGSRLTATCPPVSKTWTFVLRKHDTFDVTVENLEKVGTLSSEVWEVLKTLAAGRANILFSGNVGSGKTTLMRKLVGELHPNLRVLVIGKDLELRLAEHYTDRDIIELEEHPEVGATMKKLFETALRESPDVIIIEEFRGVGEAIEAIKACTRGHPGSMATAHFNSPEEAVEGTAMLMLEEGLEIPLNLAKLRVARAFDVVVQMLGDSVTGTRKLVSVTEIYTEGETVKFNDLVKWVPEGEEYLGRGSWQILSLPSSRLLSKMERFIPLKDIRKGFGFEP